MAYVYLMCGILTRDEAEGFWKLFTQKKIKRVLSERKWVKSQRSSSTPLMDNFPDASNKPPGT